MTRTKADPETGETLYLHEVPLEDLMDTGFRWVNSNGEIVMDADRGEGLPPHSSLPDDRTLLD